MRFFRGKVGGLFSFLAIAALVVGGLGWLTREALSMENERWAAASTREREKLQQQRDERFQETLGLIRADRDTKMRQALMLLDSRLAPALAREDSRPYEHFQALYSPYPALHATGAASQPGQFFLPSPLLTAPLPSWMILHFEFDAARGWSSPQVINDATRKLLQQQPIRLALNNADEAHHRRLDELKAAYPPSRFLGTLTENGLKFETVVTLQQFQLQQSINGATVNWSITNVNRFLVNQTAASNSSAPPAPGLNASGVANQAAAPTQQAAALGANSAQPNSLGNNDLQQDMSRRQILSLGKYEGIWSFNYDNRNAYSSVQGGQALESKLKEADSLRQQAQAASDTDKKNSLQKKLDSLQKEIDTLKRSLKPVEIHLTSMQPIWLPSPEQPKHLLMVRPVLVGNRAVYQGIALDWARLRDEILKPTIADMLPEATFVPKAKSDPERLDREMFALPIEVEPGPLSAPEAPEPVQAPPQAEARWTALRVGLVIAWSAALVALCAVGLGGWSLLAFSERRIRFVSAVTHELRTPLTTLRLYLDLLNSGLITDEKQRDEYVKTLGGEADRLHRLIGNVLDFARLEKARPTVERAPAAVVGLLEHIEQTWHERCAASGKKLHVDCALDPGVSINTDRNLVEQILGNLIDNARKYSRDAADDGIVLRAGREGDRLVFEVEDHGPGITKSERGSIFRPFRRGRDADVKAGGVGLGLALATRWAALIGGRLDVKAGAGNIGACFRLDLPE